MALYNGISADTTEKLSEEWRGDLLEIVNKLPTNYDIIDCCFATLWERAVYCYNTFGINQNNLLLNDNNGNLFEAVKLDLSGKRENSAYLRVNVENEQTVFSFNSGHSEISFSFDNDKN